MANVNTYNPSDVFLIVAGEQITGWRDITIERSTESFRFVKGIGNKHTRVRDRDSSAVITVTIIQTSELNDLFTEILTQDLENGTGRLEVSVIDKSGTTLIQSIEAYIVGYPTKVFSEAIDFLPWVIQCQSTDQFTIGGNTQPSAPALTEALKKLGIF